MGTPRPPITARPADASRLLLARLGAGLTQTDLGNLLRSRKGTPIFRNAISCYETGRWPLSEERLTYFLTVIQRYVDERKP